MSLLGAQPITCGQPGIAGEQKVDLHHNKSPIINNNVRGVWSEAGICLCPEPVALRWERGECNSMNLTPFHGRVGRGCVIIHRDKRKSWTTTTTTTTCGLRPNPVRRHLCSGHSLLALKQTTMSLSGKFRIVKPFVAVGGWMVMVFLVKSKHNYHNGTTAVEWHSCKHCWSWNALCVCFKPQKCEFLDWIANDRLRDGAAP